jgi:hypothetical protein
MTGAVMAAAASLAVTGYSGTPGAIGWGDINAVSGGSTNTVTLSGVTGSMSVSATMTGGATLYYTLNGVNAPYAGPFAWPEGQSLIWYVIGAGAGTITVTNASAGTTLSSFTYNIAAPTGRNLDDF